jgi:hypothetical protein
MNALALKTGAFGGLLTGGPENLGGDRMTRRMPAVAGKQPVGGFAPKPAPVDAQCIEQLRQATAASRIPPLASLMLPLNSCPRTAECRSSGDSVRQTISTTRNRKLDRAGYGDLKRRCWLPRGLM